MKDVLLGMTSKNLEGSPVSWGEMLNYIDLCLLMSSIATGVNTRTYWDNKYPSPFKGAHCRLHSVVTFSRVGAITKSLSFTDHSPPLYSDKFWEVRKMILAWNWHMSVVVLAG